MKWLLITGLYNPGDCFARFGVDTLIREVDPEATFDLLNKEEPEAWNEREYDRAVICGQPMFWSHKWQTCSEIWWWEKMFRGWLFEKPRKFMAMGVGNFLGKDGIRDSVKYLDAIEEVIECCWAVTTRNPILNHPKLIDSICPSVFAIEPDREIRQRDGVLLCNLMPHGGHEPEMDLDEVKAWTESIPYVADHCRKNGFEFVAHSGKEAEFAANLGFKKIHIFFDPHKYLTLYTRCVDYIGNRLHGAMVALKAGASVTAIGYDSRVQMLEQIGFKSMKPSELNGSFNRQRLSPWGIKKIDDERQKMKKLLIEFMSDK